MSFVKGTNLILCLALDRKKNPSKPRTDKHTFASEAYPNIVITTRCANNLTDFPSSIVSVQGMMMMMMVV